MFLIVNIEINLYYLFSTITTILVVQELLNCNMCEMCFMYYICKGKGKVTLYVPWRNMGEWDHSSAHSWRLGEAEWLASCLYCFTPSYSPLHWIGGWLLPGVGVGILEKRRISYLWQKLHWNSSVIQPIAQSLYQPTHSCSLLCLGKSNKAMEDGYALWKT